MSINVISSRVGDYIINYWFGKFPNSTRFCLSFFGIALYWMLEAIK